jgi:glutamate synthase domain-containing protein 2
LVFVRNALVGAGLRDRVRLAASGKLVTGFDLATAVALGADWCNSARAFMFALGCIQAQSCHTNHCPVGVATQDPWRQRALDVGDKSRRIADFHRNTLIALAELLASAGVAHPSGLTPELIRLRRPSGEVVSAAEAFPILAPGELLAGTANPAYRDSWRMARAEAFTPLSA